MTKILTNDEINQFKKDGAIFLKGKFEASWIKKLQTGIEKDIKNPSPRFKSHTLEKGVPAYLEDYWTCLLYTSPSPRDGLLSRMPSSA